MNLGWSVSWMRMFREWDRLSRHILPDLMDNDSMAISENELLKDLSWVLKQTLTIWQDRKMHPIRSCLLEHQRSAFRLLISTTDHELAYCTLVEWEGTTYPSSKCLQRLSANCALVLQTVHSSLKTTFFVVLAFLWKTGFVWPPYPDCLRSYRRFPCATEEALKREENAISCPFGEL